MAWPAGPALLFDASAALSAVLRVRSTLAALAWRHGISVAEQFSSLMFVFAEECSDFTLTTDLLNMRFYSNDSCIVCFARWKRSRSQPARWFQWVPQDPRQDNLGARVVGHDFPTDR